MSILKRMFGGRKPPVTPVSQYAETAATTADHGQSNRLVRAIEVAFAHQNAGRLQEAEGSAYAIEAIDPQTRKLRFLNQQPSSGDNGPHLMVDPTDRYVVCANGPGIVVLPINADGSLAPASDVVAPPGKAGPYKREQGHGAHPHQVVLDAGGRFLIAPDKGIDATHIYRLDAASGKPAPTGLIIHTGSPSCIAFSL